VDSAHGELDPIEAAKRVRPRPCAARACSADDVVPLEDARPARGAGGDSVDFRIVANGPHRLRHDPLRDRQPSCAGLDAKSP